MAETFDPYLQWLGIRDQTRPPNHYRLLGLELLESDPNIIANAADRQMAHVRTFQSGRHGEISQRVLNELSAARLCLLQTERKTAYDAALQASLAARKQPAPLRPVGAVPATPAQPRPRPQAAAPTPVAIIEPVDELATFASAGRSSRKRPPKKKSKGPLVLVLTLLLAAGVFAAVALKFNVGAGNSKNVAQGKAKSDAPSQAASVPRDAVASPDTPPSPPAPPVAAVPKPAVPRPAVKTPRGQQPDDAAVPPDAVPADAVPTDEAPSDPDTPNDMSPDAEPATPEPGFGDPPQEDVSESGAVPKTAPGEAIDLVALLTALPKAVQPRVAVPDSDALKAAQAQVKTIFKQEFEAAATADKKQELAKLLLAKAAESGDDAVGQYALLKMAEELALKAAEATLMLDALEQRTKRFEVDTLQEKSDALIKLSKIPRNPALQDQVLLLGTELIGEAMAANRFSLAQQLAKLSVTLATKSGNRDAAKEANRRDKEIREQQRAYDAAIAAAEKLQADPNDAEANLKAGRYLCLMRQDWGHGLPLLAKSGDEKLQALAVLDLTGASKSAKQVELADRWWELAAGNAAMQQRAQHWYRQALPSVAGLAKAHVESRLATADSSPKSSEPAAGGRTLQIALNDKVKMSFRRIAAGKFMMGSGANEPNTENLELQHPVTLTKPFYIGATEVTQGQWQAVMNVNPSERKGDNLPVHNVSWDNCVAFCETLNKSPLGGKYHFRLPTEAEWEYACRAGSPAIFFFGADTSQINQFAWTAANSESTAHAVSQLKPNAWGLYDMLGNVNEWCQDTLNPYPSGPQTNPFVTKEARSRSHRGGNAWLKPELCRSASRYGNPAGESRNWLGFRLVVDTVDSGK